jgi:hypothetical protein
MSRSFGHLSPNNAASHPDKNGSLKRREMWGFYEGEVLDFGLLFYETLQIDIYKLLWGPATAIFNVSRDRAKADDLFNVCDFVRKGRMSSIEKRWVKVVPVQAMKVWGSGGVSSLILNLDTRWKWMSSFTLWQFDSRYSLKSGLNGL